MPEPFWADDDVTLYHGRCEDVLPDLPAESVDAIVTDPPAAIAFMNRTWDSDLGGRRQWVAWLTGCMEKAARVLKPGGHLLVWSLPRTSHWTAWALEDAGLEIRDCILHLFGSGFPKSLDVSKAIDRMAGAEREIVGPKMRPDGKTVLSASPGGGSRSPGWERPWRDDADAVAANATVTAPATPEAARWEGWGTALKPGQEMWWLARKPLKGTVAANVLEFGTGALNIDGCKVNPGTPVPGGGGLLGGAASRHEGWRRESHLTGEPTQPHNTGRWPANIIFTHSVTCDDRCAPGCPVAELDRQSGVLTSGANPERRRSDKFRDAYGEFAGQETCIPHRGADVGGASRFYPIFRYQAKAPTSERPRLKDGTAHETVKSLDLMRWMVRLIAPPGGTVLDLYAGSGPTAEACIIEGFNCVLIEQDPKSCELIKTRLSKPIQPVMFGMEAS